MARHDHKAKTFRDFPRTRDTTGPVHKSLRDLAATMPDTPAFDVEPPDKSSAELRVPWRAKPTP